MSLPIDSWLPQPATSSVRPGQPSFSSVVASGSAKPASKDSWDDSSASEPEDGNDKAPTKASVAPARGTTIAAPTPRAALPTNADIWESANNANKMPDIVPSGGGPSTGPVVPTVVLSGPMRILKRPSAGGSPTPGSLKPASSGAKPLAEREAEYQAARERIFGSGGTGGGDSSEPSSRSQSRNSRRGEPGRNSGDGQQQQQRQTQQRQQHISRQPRGPSGQPGFGAYRAQDLSGDGSNGTQSPDNRQY